MKLKDKYPNLWEFVMFNLLSNCATVTNFIVMWLCTGLIFKNLRNIPFTFLFFNYQSSESLMLCGFLSFLTATAAAQTVNFFVQKHLVFCSNVGFKEAAKKYIVLAIMLVIISSALPGYSQSLLSYLGVPNKAVPTLANVINIIVQVALSYPLMKFWIMPKKKEKTK